MAYGELNESQLLKAMRVGLIISVKGRQAVRQWVVIWIHKNNGRFPIERLRNKKTLKGGEFICPLLFKMWMVI